jgi:mannose-1-phosphate guanylyltransferase
LKHAESLLDERFLMLNGDVLTDIDVSSQLRQHAATGARGTLALYPVEDPSAYGLVRLAPDSAVTEFVEKPSADQIDTNNISAGVYVLERSVLELLAPGEPASIERDVFPELVGHGLYGHVSPGYWMDIGTPERYLQATFDILEGNVATEVGTRMGSSYVCVEGGVESAGRVIPPALVETGCRIGDAARIGAEAVLERDVTVGEGTTIERSVVLEGATIGAHCTLRGCIVGAGVQIGDHCVVEGMSVLGAGVSLGAGNVVAQGARVFPGVALPDHALLF